MANSCFPVTLLLLVVVVAGCLGYKPLIHPDHPEMIINEGDELVITCTSISDFKIAFPETDPNEFISTSPFDIFHDNKGTTTKRRFQRKKTVFGDSGWYGCLDESADESDEGDFNDPNASWIYVYVKSNENVFVQEAEMQSLVASVGDTLVLPCRPTSPELHVDLELNYEPISEMDERISFDPRKGFVMKKLTATDSGLYTCKIKQGDDFVEQDINLKVVQKKDLKEPIISKDNLQHVTKGSELNVTCTAEINADTSYVFTWTTPRNTAVKKVYNLNPVRTNPHTLLATSVLNIDSVTYDDEGEYFCQVKTLTDSARTRQNIQVFDPDDKFLDLTSHDQKRYYQINESSLVTFSAYVHAYPSPSLTWLDPELTPISPSTNFVIKNTHTSALLQINRVSAQDSGVYALQAVNEHKVEQLNFTLEVLAKPYAILKEDQEIAFYSVNQTTTFSCMAYNNPPTNMSIFYYKCPYYPSTEDCEKVEIEDTVIEHESLKDLRVRVKFQVDMAGRINCEACNAFGCEFAEQEILVTDGVPNKLLGIIAPDIVTANDNVVITCVAPIYNSSTVEWLDLNDQPIRNTDRVQVSFENTTFSRRAVLNINDVHKSDEDDYMCVSRDLEQMPESIQYHLKVYDPVEPTIKATNMNGSEIALTTDEAHNIIHLTCYVEGRPPPNITWYKDDQPIESNEQQFTIIHDNQELVINYLMEHDSGEYSCVAKNRVSQAKASQIYLVKGAEISKSWIIIIIALLILLIGLSIYFCIKIRRERRMRKQLIEAGLMHFEEGALDCINPDLTVDDQADLLPYDRKWEFPRDKLKLGKQLGSGAFGVVMKAEARGILPDESSTTVAVKMVHRNAEPAYIRALASELKIMVHLGKHLNVVNLLGACTNNIAKRELLVIVEYCRYGNLHNYLLRHRDNFINQIDPETERIDPLIGSELLLRSTSVGSNNRVKYAALSFSRSLSSASDNRSAPGTETVIYTTDTQDITGLPEAAVNSNGSQPGWRSNYRGDYKDRNLKPICTQDLLSWAFQVARGMEYLCQRKVLHGDLAARNILLAENNVVKICDFGLAKTMYKDDNYQKKGNGPVPIKWMAIESIRDRVFSTQSDIWSFGIVLWEFFTLAETPYPGMMAEKQYQRLIEGYRMEQPKYATKDIYNIMLQCWKAKPTLRPSFSQLVEDIGELLEEGVKRHYTELNSLYIDTIDEQHDYLKMMSAPDHEAIAGSQHDYVNCPPIATDSAYLSMNSPLSDSEIFSPQPNSQGNTRFQFPSPVAAKIANANNSDGEESPMLKKPKEEPELDDDNYLKPIDVQKKREEFTRQREAEKRQSQERNARASTDRDSGYCNTPKGLELVDVKVDTPNYRNLDDIDAPSVIVKAPDDSWRYNMQKQSKPESFMNPSYIFVESSKPNQEAV